MTSYICKLIILARHVDKATLQIASLHSIKLSKVIKGSFNVGVYLT